MKANKGILICTRQLILFLTDAILWLAEHFLITISHTHTHKKVKSPKVLTLLYLWACALRVPLLWGTNCIANHTSYGAGLGNIHLYNYIVYVSCNNRILQMFINGCTIKKSELNLWKYNNYSTTIIKKFRKKFTWNRTVLDIEVIWLDRKGRKFVHFFCYVFFSLQAFLYFINKLLLGF